MEKTMKAAFLPGNSTVVLRDVPVPEPDHGEVLIRMKSSTICIMFPTIFALGIRGLGEQTKQASSFIVMAIVGGAIVPMLMGKIADVASMRVGFIVPLACFIVIGVYAASWQKLDSSDAAM